jgi:uncharacterized protein
MRLKNPFLLSCLLVAAAPAFAQSLNCDKPANPADHFICQDQAACYSENGMLPKEYATQIESFYQEALKSPDKDAAEKAQQSWLEKRAKCGEGSSLTDSKARFQAHDCLCKVLEERFTQLRYAKRSFDGKPARDFIALMRGALKTGSSFSVASVYCTTGIGSKDAVVCKIRNTSDKIIVVADPQAKKIQDILIEIGFGSAAGGLGRQGQAVLNVKCSGGKCSWECDQSMGAGK